MKKTVPTNQFKHLCVILALNFSITWGPTPLDYTLTVLGKEAILRMHALELLEYWLNMNWNRERF